MTVLGRIEKGLGKRGYFIDSTSASITGAATITTGLSSIQGSPIPAVQDAATTIPSESASVTSVSGGVVSVVVIKHEATANSISGSAKTVGVIAVGE